MVSLPIGWKFLAFRSVGHAGHILYRICNKEVAVTPDKSLQVVLVEDNQTLDEVIVVGYGSVKKSNLTGAVSSVKMADIPMVTTTSVFQIC